MIKSIFKLSTLALVFGSASAAFAGTSTLAIQGGYGLTNNDSIKGGATGSLAFEFMTGKSWGVGFFGGYQQLTPEGVFSSLKMYSIPYGLTLNYHAGSSFYLGANVGAQKFKVSSGSGGLAGGENFAGGQVGLMLSSKLGLEGRYFYSLAEGGGLNLMQAVLQYRFGI